MMERLTLRYTDGSAGLNPAKMPSMQPIYGKAIDRLAAYEDTGLEPEEITRSDDTLKALVEHNRNSDYPRTLDWLLNIAKAESEGRLVVLPNIKKYKTLYWLWGDMIMPVQYLGIIGGTTRAGDGKFHVTCKMRTKKSRDFHKERRETYTVPAGESRYFYADDIGKTVFLTREEAEAALGKEAKT